jgi:hypothetical protein
VPPSLGNLPRINQGRQVETDDIHLQFDSIVVLNHGANDGIVNLPPQIILQSRQRVQSESRVSLTSVSCRFATPTKHENTCEIGLRSAQPARDEGRSSLEHEAR